MKQSKVASHLRRMAFVTMTFAVIGFGFAGHSLLNTAMAADGKGTTIDRGDGIHSETWWQNSSFGDLRDEVSEAKNQGKLLALVFEQQGCGSCERLHTNHMQDPGIYSYLKEHFVIMPVNMYGETEMTTMDGEAMPEKDLAAEMLINFTPTTVFFDEEGKEVFRVPGLPGEVFYLAAYVYVNEKGYADPEHRGMFARWTKANTDHWQAVYEAGKKAANDS